MGPDGRLGSRSGSGRQVLPMTDRHHAPAHSVAQHLHLDIREYDRIIRTFIPGYDQMFDVVAGRLADAGASGLVLDLGGGTGGLSERVLERCPGVAVEIWDIDDAMLAVARKRLERFGDRVTLVHRSFEEPMRPCAAVVASLALHHVRELDAKIALYGRICAALGPRGGFLNADVTIPREPDAAAAAYRRWADHMVTSGIPETEAWRNFDSWGSEDRYFSLEEELAALGSAGFQEPECFWRLGPATVFGAIQHAA